MVTEIFGVINLQHHRAVSVRMSECARYRTVHSWHEISSNEGSLGAVVIGEKRESGVLPPLLQEEKLTICADITLYNRQELKKRLHLEKDYTDIEILLQAYRAWDYKCVDHLCGDFAFAIWDGEKQELFCARDHIGLRPFFYTQSENGLIFASELRFLKAAHDHKPGLNKDFLLDTIVTVISDKSQTAFENIFRLPPAHRLIFKDGKIRIEQYWGLDSRQIIRYKTENEYIESFREMLVNAVEARCSGICNLASELSGGLDSTLVSCVAATFLSEQNKVFTAFSNTLPDNHGTVMIDEREHIQNVLGWKKFNWCEVNGLQNTIPEILDHTINTQGCFTQQRFHMFNKGIYEAAGKSGADVLLSGFGGDEMISARTGNAPYDLIREKKWQRLFMTLKHDTILPKAFFKVLRALCIYYLKKNRKPGTTSGVFKPDMLKKRLSTLPLWPEFVKKNQLKERYFTKHQKKDLLLLAERQLQKVDHPHVSQRIEYSYAAAAQYGLQYRYPLLDIKLLQTCLSFPAWLKNQPGEDRYLFRQAVKGLVPENIRLRKDKTGAVIPHIYTRLKKDSELLSDFFKHSAGDDYLKSIFNFSRFDSWMESLLERNPNDMNYLMPGAFYNHLMIMYWFKKYDKI